MDFVFEIVGWRSKAGSDLNGSFERTCCFEFSPHAVCGDSRLLLLT